MLGRSAAVRFVARRGAATAGATKPSETPSQPPVQTSNRTERQASRKPNQNFNQFYSEQFRLQKKHGETLQKNDLENLHQAVEHIEWRGSVYEKTLEKLVQLLKNETELKSLSDRQLAVVFTAFGNICDTCPTAKRQRHLEQALSQLNGASVGLLTSNAILEAKLENGVELNAVEEIQKLDSQGLEADTKTYALLAQIYANVGDTKAVANILAHMKQVGLTVGEDHVAAMVYAVARSGNEGHIDLVIEKFAGSLNVARLRCTAAQAIISRSKSVEGNGAYEVCEQLHKIPTTAKLMTLDNNKFVIDVLIDLVDAGQLDALKLLSPYLLLSEDGTTLSERHLNKSLVSKAKSLQQEGRLQEALAIYTAVHPNFKNEFFETGVRHSLRNAIEKTKPEDVEALLRTVTTVGNKGIVENTDEFLLFAALKSPSFDKIFEHVKSTGRLREAIERKPGLKTPLAKRLGHSLVTSPSPLGRAKILADIAQVLFIPSEEETLYSLISYYNILYRLGSTDVKLPVVALEQMSDIYVKREYTTAVVHELLRNSADDHLAMDKLTVFLDHPEAKSLFAVRLQKQLIKLLRTKDGQSAEESRLKLAARICALDFGTEAKYRVSFSAKNLAQLFSNALISDNTVVELVSLLDADSNVSLSKEEIAIAQEILKDSPKKAEAIAKLKRSQTFSRWKSTALPELLAEANRLAEVPEINPGVLKAVRELILTRAVSEKRDDVELLLTVVEQAAAWLKSEDKKSTPQIKYVRTLESTALGRAVAQKNLVLADRVWSLKAQQLYPLEVLTYASSLFVDGHQERADQVCADLRSSAQPIDGKMLGRLGRQLQGVDLEKLTHLTSYLEKQFNLSTSQTRGIAEHVKVQALNELIQKEKLDAALALALEATKTSNRAFGQIPLMVEALRRNDRQLLEQVHVMIRSVHDLSAANVNLAYALISAGYVDKAKNLVEKQGLVADDKVLSYFTNYANASGSAETLHGLFKVFHTNASTLILNTLLEKLTRIYWRQEKIDELYELKKEIDAAAIPLQHQLRVFFDNLEKKTTPV